MIIGYLDPWGYFFELLLTGLLLVLVQVPQYPHVPQKTCFL